MSRVLAGAFWLLFSACVQAEEKKDPSTKASIEPVILEGKNQSGATLGVQWLLQDAKKWSLPGSDSGSAGIDPNAPVGKLAVGYKLAGTAAANKDRNPKNFLEAQLDGRFLYDAQPGAVSAGLLGKYEADQSFDNKQWIYGVRAAGAKYGLLHPQGNDFFALYANIARVDPINDKERKAAIGTPLSPYNRWDAEALFMVPLGWTQITAIELNYRYFREIAPPAAISAAGLDTHYLATVRLALKGDLYVAYSQGKLPFDRASDKIFELGWSFKLKG